MIFFDTLPELLKIVPLLTYIVSPLLILTLSFGDNGVRSSFCVAVYFGSLLIIFSWLPSAQIANYLVYAFLGSSIILFISIYKGSHNSILCWLIGIVFIFFYLIFLLKVQQNTSLIQIAQLKDSLFELQSSHQCLIQQTQYLSNEVQKLTAGSSIDYKSTLLFKSRAAMLILMLLISFSGFFFYPWIKSYFLYLATQKIPLFYYLGPFSGKKTILDITGRKIKLFWSLNKDGGCDFTNVAIKTPETDFVAAGNLKKSIELFSSAVNKLISNEELEDWADLADCSPDTIITIVDWLRHFA